MGVDFIQSCADASRIMTTMSIPHIHWMEISHSLFGVYQRPQNKIEGNFPLGVTQAALATIDSGPEPQ